MKDEQKTIDLFSLQNKIAVIEGGSNKTGRAIADFVFALIGGLMAKTFGRKFWLWLWFCISLFLPVISCMTLLCLPDKAAQQNK